MRSGGHLVDGFSVGRSNALCPKSRNLTLETGGAGVRAQAMEASGTLVQDFAFIERKNALHLINAPSPAATAALAIAEEIAKKIPQAV